MTGSLILRRPDDNLGATVVILVPDNFGRSKVAAAKIAVPGAHSAEQFEKMTGR